MTPDDIAYARHRIAAFRTFNARSRALHPGARSGHSDEDLDGWSAALDEVERLRAIADAAERAIEVLEDQAAQAAKTLEAQTARIR